MDLRDYLSYDKYRKLIKGERVLSKKEFIFLRKKLSEHSTVILNTRNYQNRDDGFDDTINYMNTRGMLTRILNVQKGLVK